MGAVTVSNTNVNALVAAAQTAFAQYGYRVGPSNYPSAMSFEKQAGGFGKLMYGSYDETTTFRVWMSMTQIPGTNDYRLGTRATRVADAGEAGFEESTKMAGFWSGQFGPILKQIQSQAAGAGPIPGAGPLPAGAGVVPNPASGVPSM